MFVAKFKQTTSEKFNPNRHEVMPYIGTLVSGEAHNTIIDGTIFNLLGLSEDVNYLCNNEKVIYEGKEKYNVIPIEKIESTLELIRISRELGEAKLVRPDSSPE